MAQDSDHLAGFDTENTGGFLSGLLADEDHVDRRALWRLGSWGVATVGAVVIAVLANQSSTGLRREITASADQSQQIQSVAKESQNEARRLASAIETLNSDRDRLYARVTVLEQGLDSVTGAIARQNAAPAWPQAAAAVPATPEPPQPAAQNPAPAPVVSPVAAAPAKPPEKPSADAAPVKDSPTRDSSPATVSPVAQAAQNSPQNSPAVTPATPLMASKSMLAPPDAPPGKLIPSETPTSAITASPMPEVVASAPSANNAERDLPKAVQRTEFGVDVGGANSLGGLRALWRGLLKSKSNAPLLTLRPIIVVKESNSGLGMQLRLVVGPLADAAAAAKICAAMIESERTCETTVFDGQRLSMKATEEMPAPVTKPLAPRKRSSAKRVEQDEPPKKPETPTTSTTSTLSSMFSRVTRAQ